MSVSLAPFPLHVYSLRRSSVCLDWLPTFHLHSPSSPRCFSIYPPTFSSFFFPLAACSPSEPFLRFNVLWVSFSYALSFLPPFSFCNIHQGTSLAQAVFPPHFIHLLRLCPRAPSVSSSSFLSTLLLFSFPLYGSPYHSRSFSFYHHSYPFFGDVCSCPSFFLSFIFAPPCVHF